MTIAEIVPWIIGLITAFGGGGIVVALIDRKNKKDQIQADKAQHEDELQTARDQAASEQLQRMGDVALTMVEPLSKRILALEEERTRLWKQVNTLDCEIEKLRSQLDSKDAKIIQMEGMITQRDGEIMRLQRDLKSRDQQITDLRQRVSELEKGLPKHG